MPSASTQQGANTQDSPDSESRTLSAMAVGLSEASRRDAEGSAAERCAERPSKPARSALLRFGAQPAAVSFVQNFRPSFVA
jgi:hypothetical protein